MGAANVAPAQSHFGDAVGSLRMQHHAFQPEFLIRTPGLFQEFAQA